MKILILFFSLAFTFTSTSVKSQFSISGNVTSQSLSIVNARVTLFNTDTSFFREDRTLSSGNYLFSNIPTGAYTLGVAKLDHEYFDTLISLTASVANLHITLSSESNKGMWDVIMNSPERLGGTDLGILMPNGNIYYCHDTEDPFYFDPTANDTISVAGDTAVQGCVGPILCNNGDLWFFGGTLQNVYGPGTKKVKSFNPKNANWKIQKNMFDYRWYPSVSPLPNGNILIAGGGGLSNPLRVKTSEVYNTQTSTFTRIDDIAIGNEVSPILPLHNGKTLMTHRPPQLFDPVTNEWDLAGDFVQSNRMSNGDHSDHELVLLSNGSVLAIGFKPFNNPLGTFVEIYDPSLNQWSLKSSINPIRSRAKAVILPDKRILVANGQKEDGSNHTPVNQWGYMKRTDLYNSNTDTWRNVADMNYFREYHAIITLVPDGRLIAVGGEGQPGNEPPLSIIEAYKPPYLFRGVRPEIHNLNNTEFPRGGKINFNIAKTDSITGVHLMSNAVNTHFMNSSSNRFLELAFTQNGGSISASLPSDSLLVHAGFYMLFAMVDDIPSMANIIQVLDSTTTVFTGMEENIIENTLRIYPNPFGEFISIQSTIPVVKAKITNITGRVLLAIAAQNIQHIKTENLDTGYYLLSVHFENGQSTTRKIVRHQK